MGAHPPVTVITSVYDGYDPLRPQVEQTIAADWLCVSDGQSDIPARWTPIIERRPHLHPRMAAKLARCRPDLYTDSPITVWLDASAALTQPDSLEQLLAVLGDGLIAQYPHPERWSILAEADVSAQLRKYQHLPVHAQVAHYTTDGYPLGFGLWATGCIVRRNTPQTAQFGDMWLREMWRWGWQDQLSEPYALWRCDLRPVDLPGNLWDDTLVSFEYGLRGRDD